jgi:hypothetical protein
MDSLPEPWLRGPLVGVHPLLAPVLYAFQHAREDLAAATKGMDAGQIWARPHGIAPVGFHLRHIAGSVDRLTSYLEGRPLNLRQMDALNEENNSGAARAEFLSALDGAFAAAESVVRSLDPGRLAEPRTVGRKHLPTTAIGLLTHIAEHTLRHVGQTVTTARIVRASQ